MNDLMRGQAQLGTFLESVKFQNPDLADALLNECTIVSLHSLSLDKTGGIEAADNLRRAAFRLPAIHARVLESALIDLGF